MLFNSFGYKAEGHSIFTITQKWTADKIWNWVKGST